MTRSGTTRRPGISGTTTEGAKSKAGRSLLMHIQQYAAKGFSIKRVTSDGEASVRAVKSDVEALGVELNILGHGSHTPHAEAAIRHIKNKARSTMYSLPYSLPSKLAAALIAFVVHTSNIVPKVNAVGHLPAHTAFMGRVPNFSRDAPYAFGTAGFLQRVQGPLSNTAAPRGDYCIWIGTTRCLNLDTLREITGDIFRPALLTNAAIQRLSQLAGVVGARPSTNNEEIPLENLTPRYALDPTRGVAPDPEQNEESPMITDIVPADSLTCGSAPVASGEVDLTGASGEADLTSRTTERAVTFEEPEIFQREEVEIERETVEPEDDLQEGCVPDRTETQAAELVDVRNSINKGYNLRASTRDKHV